MAIASPPAAAHHAAAVPRPQGSSTTSRSSSIGSQRNSLQGISSRRGSNSSAAPQLDDFASDIDNDPGVQRLRDPSWHVYQIDFASRREHLVYHPAQAQASVPVAAEAGHAQLLCPDEFQPAEWVIVEGDRGCDLGQVFHHFTPAEKSRYADTVVARARERDRLPVVRRILRRAHQSELDQLLQKSKDEQLALQICQTMAIERNMPLQLLGAEYQFDRLKLTFYFASEVRIDFRELVRSQKKKSEKSCTINVIR
eukprot:TRINITY_DN6713_c0_g1_i2.p1 TRINITY_DN6713_c0_g1~~TRINITY_DN6713_c0_g1_i2.p1  ORF type:complete len:283 (+),score=46.24 TRINITY_DN6713_c0_g1_i2:88-849(+)